MKHAQNLSLKEIIAHDLKLAMYFVRHGEFMEGIRALIIDKDNAPKWRYTWDEMASMNPNNQPFDAFLTRLFADNHKSLANHTD